MSSRVACLGAALAVTFASACGSAAPAFNAALPTVSSTAGAGGGALLDPTWTPLPTATSDRRFEDDASSTSTDQPTRTAVPLPALPAAATLAAVPTAVSLPQSPPTATVASVPEAGVATSSEPLFTAESLDGDAPIPTLETVGPTDAPAAPTAQPPTPSPPLAAEGYLGPFDPFGPDRDCGDFATHREAQAFFVAAGGPAGDPHRLDANHDGIACESLP